jgi:3-methyl-2-oxobutanoate hydroxymethyltransferase
MKRLNIHDIMAHKGKEPLVALTAYTASSARLLDEYVDILLVGDSLGMVLYGMENTLPVTVAMMIAHGSAVVRSSKKALIVVDLPFGSYQASPAQACETATAIIAATGCGAVKLEGGTEMEETVKFLVERGIPVMGHVGLKPQSVNAMGGYRTQGKDEAAAKKLLADAKALEKAGAFSIVIEGVVETVAKDITSNLSIPTIGIGASAACDGQVLVIDDMLGAGGEYIPSFVKRYADVAGITKKAVEEYSKEVRARKFPSAEYCYPYKKD